MTRPAPRRVQVPPTAYESAYRRQRHQGAAVTLTVDRDPRQLRRWRADVLFRAADGAGAGVTLALDASAWNSLEADGGFDPYDELELLALSGHWEPHGGGRVWRVTLI